MQSYIYIVSRSVHIRKHVHIQKTYVTMAKVSWNIMKTDSGIVPLIVAGTIRVPPVYIARERGT